MIEQTGGMSSPRLLKGRRSIIGNCYCITTVTAGRRRLFADDVRAGLLVDEMRGARNGWAVSSLAWVLMPDHLHWLFRLESGTLSGHMQRFKMLTAQAINRQTEAKGAVWQPGFHDHCIRDERSLARIARYLVENPVRAGLVRKVEDYPYWHCIGVESASDLW